MDAIKFDDIGTIGLWRVEAERLVMEEALEWLENDDDVSEEEEFEEEDPLPTQTNLEEIEGALQSMRPLPQRISTRGRGGRHTTLAFTFSPSPSILVPIVTWLLSNSKSTSTCPPIASRGLTQLLTFANKRARGNYR